MPSKLTSLELVGRACIYNAIAKLRKESNVNEARARFVEAQTELAKRTLTIPQVVNTPGEFDEQAFRKEIGEFFDGIVKARESSKAKITPADTLTQILSASQSKS